MNQLRLLKVNYNMVQISEDFELPSHDLAYFHWDKYPLECLPSNFHADNLVELNLQFSNIKHLWKGNTRAKKLKVINLSHSRHLVDISSITSVQNLEILILEGCTSLESLPRNLHKLECLQTLSCKGCSGMKSFPKIEGNMGRLRELNLSQTTIEEVTPSIRHIHGLEDLYLSYCENLVSLPDSICSLSSLQTLSLDGCSKLKGFPDINIGSLKAIELLDLSFCENLESLPVGICNLSSLQTLFVQDCSKLKGFPDINIGSLEALELLDLSFCKNLKSLPMSICNLSSLKTLRVSYCPKLEAILEVNLGVDLCSLRSLSLPCRILKSGVIWSNDRFSSLKRLNPWCDQSKYHICPLSSLVELCVRNCNLMERDILSGSFHLSSLQILSLRNFHLMEGEILNDIFHLSSLVKLSLSNCNLMEGEIPNHICQLSSLEELSLEGNYFSSIPSGISQLSNLRALNLSHCKNLVQIPKLPSSLRFLDVHCSDGIASSPSFLSIHSLINCFKSELIQESWISVGGSLFQGHGISIVIPRSSGILEWIRYQSMRSDEVTMELPPNWYENNDLLGFALCCVYVASAHESQNESENGSACESENEESLKFYCKLSIRGNNQSADVEHFLFASGCVDDGVSDIVWVICYPKVAITEWYPSDQWTRFMASFSGLRRVEECGIRLIYAEDYEQKHPTMAQGSSSHRNFGER